MNSAPPSVGDSTLLCRCTVGSPGISPSSTSSRLGFIAAVTETVSPSQLMPSEVHRMCTSLIAVLSPQHGLRQLPQRVIQRDLRLLDAMHGGGRDDEEVVDGSRLRHAAAVVAREP